MKTKLSLLILTALISSSAFSAVVRSKDYSKNCVLYRVTTEKAPKQARETVIIEKEAYGLSTEDMEVDFDAREVKVNLTANIVFGFNRVLATKARILEGNTDFKNLTNQLNRKVMLLERACVDSQNEIVYARPFPTEETK